MKIIKINSKKSKLTKTSKIESTKNSGVTFIVGKSYADGAGEYIVDSIADDQKTMTVTYSNGRFSGETKTYDVGLKAAHWKFIRQRIDRDNRMETLNFDGDEHSWALGYLSSFGIISADIPSDQRQWFEDMYKQLTGDDAKLYLNKNYYLTKPESKYTLELRIKFPSTTNKFKEILHALGVNIIESNNGMEINNNNFIKNLFQLGFHLGKNKDRSLDIAEKIRGVDINAFIKGCEAEVN